MSENRSAHFYPVFLDLRGKHCLVVGGGAVAAQKAKALARCGARVTLVAPRVLPGLRTLTGVRVLRRPFRAADLGNASRRPWLVAAATDDESLNARVSRLCLDRGIWANVADRPDLCGFILPAVARQGPVVFAVSTGGASPALAKFAAKTIAAAAGPA